MQARLTRPPRYRTTESTLRLTADDSAASSSDDVVITVNPAPVVKLSRMLVLLWPLHCQTLRP